MGYTPIREYAPVGNDDRIALVDTGGSIDWCCFPHVAGPSVFASLLDDDDGGHFAVAPTDTHESRQAYRDDTNVLETTFETAAGRATLTDFMPVGCDHRYPDVQRALYRHLRCDEGRLVVEVDFKPRPGYARPETDLRRVDDSSAADGHLVAETDDDALTLQVRGPLDLAVSDGRAVGTTLVEEGESLWLVLQHDHYERFSRETCRAIQNETVAYWQEWVDSVCETAAEIVDERPWREAVVRSALVLKLLINEGSGAIYAAATTSLPEAYGGSRNWDYRYNWLRDAKLTVQALANLGREPEVTDYFEWFREISHEDPGEIQPVYGVHGERDLTERRLEHLGGYRHSSPVRVGNGAAGQRQLDVYGEIVEAIAETLADDGHLAEDDLASLRRLVDHVCDVWDEPDRGIWEYRQEPRHYVHSKLLCWVALDRAIDLFEAQPGCEVPDRWHDERRALREAIETRGYSESAGSFLQHFDAEETVDATSLLIPVYEFLPADDERVQHTLDTVLDRLVVDGGLVRRTAGPDAPPEGQSAFLLCSFWLTDVLALAGRVDRARRVFENVLEYVSAPTILSERVDPATGELLGNYPQAFSHIGLINSAIYLASVTDGCDLRVDPLANRGGDE